MNKQSIILLAGLFVALIISGCGSSSDSDEKTLTLLQTTDVHHRASGSGASRTFSPLDGIDSSDSADLTQGGYSRLVTKIAEIRKAKKTQNTLLVDSGDFLMGTVYDFSLGGGPNGTKLPSMAFAFMEGIKYDAITLGNHEFDFGPDMLAFFLGNALGENGTSFTVPVVASNMVTDGTTGTSDDGLEQLKSQGVIKGTLIKKLGNGLKVGIIGLLGADAESKAPLTAPVTFINDMTNDDQIAALQTIVTNLKAEVDIVVALSHSGVSNTDPANPAGDDITIAQKITGIDVIASGHDHVPSESIIEVQNGDHTTYVFCAGHYGKKLAQLDVTFKSGTGITNVSFTNHTIDDSIAGDEATQGLVGVYEFGINAALQSSGLTINSLLGTTDSNNVGKPYRATESGLGNLVADSLRFVSLPPADATPTVGVVANGVLRNGFSLGQGISFADLFSVLPLGMSLDPAQQNVPGYPLVKVYLTGEEIKNMCQLISYVIAADDDTFVTALPAMHTQFTDAETQARTLATLLSSGSTTDINTYNGVVVPMAGNQVADMAIAAFNAVGTNDSAACLAAAAVFTGAADQARDAALLTAENALQRVLPLLGTDFFLNISGVQFTHTGSAGLYQIDEASVKMYQNTDVKCQGTPTVVDDATYYPVIVDIYVVLMMKEEQFVAMMSADGLRIPVVPTNADGSVDIDKTNIMNYTIKNGEAEIKEWQALLTYLTTAATSLGLESVIPDSAYGTDALNAANSSRINQP